MDDSSDGAFRLSGCLRPERCIVLERAGKREVLDKLIRLLSGPGGAGEECEIARGIHARERLLSTGIGLGVAIPHVRLASVHGLEIAAALVRGGVADYGSPDAVPVRLVVMIVARIDQHELYLRVLSRLSSLLKEDGFRERVFGCADAAGLCAAFTED